MFILPDLPYRPDALSPVISAETLRFHHGKHHRTYVETLNRLLDESGETPDSLEDVVRGAAGDPDKAKLFNNAAQAWNHGFFWDAMTPGDTAPAGALAGAIETAFGDLAGLRTAFVTAGVEHFGSGWVWLLAERGRLKVVSTHDAAGPLTIDSVVPLTVCDLWEHAYYLDHQNDRKGFLEAWFDGILNWDLAARQFAAAQGQGAAWAYPEPTGQAGTARRTAR
ncbi:MAG: superoxide dismutase [Caulobacter sp.]|nr:superoxide dismutase [Caulobacter sp.]